MATRLERRVEYWKPKLEPLLRRSQKDHEERERAFNAIIDNIDKIPGNELRHIWKPSELVVVANRHDLLGPSVVKDDEFEALDGTYTVQLFDNATLSVIGPDGAFDGKCVKDERGVVDVEGVQYQEDDVQEMILNTCREHFDG